MTQHLDRFDQVLQALGGLPATAGLTERNAFSVYRWKAAGRFPPATYRTITTALADRGFTASIDLFDFEPRNKHEGHNGTQAKGRRRSGARTRA